MTETPVKKNRKRPVRRVLSPEEIELRNRMKTPRYARAAGSVASRKGLEGSHHLLEGLEADVISRLVVGKRIEWLIDTYELIDGLDAEHVGDVEDENRYLYQSAVVHPRGADVNTERGWLIFREQSTAQGDLLVGVKWRTVRLKSIFTVR